jgi:Mrp family chromosome partitioning ATPase
MRDNLRGYTVDFLIIDEAAFISDEIFDIVLPMTNVKQAPIVIVSTPRFRTGKFYE